MDYCQPEGRVDIMITKAPLGAASESPAHRGSERARRALLSVVISIQFAPAAFSQTNPNLCEGKEMNAVICLLPNTVNQSVAPILGPDSFPKYVNPGNGIFAVQLTSALPVPSPAAGFIYTFDPTTGVPVRVSESLGPLMSERPETLGKRSIAIGFSFQRFTFDDVDGFNLHNFQTAVTLSGNVNLLGNYNLSLSLNQYTFFAVYGLTDRMDLSVGIPFNTVRYGAAFSGSLSSSTAMPLPPGLPTLAPAANTKIASGLGDVTFQVKDHLLRGERGNLAVGLAVRTPTGDEFNALGAGAFGVKPFLSGSYRFGRLTPHASAGIEWNGKSIQAGNVLTGDKRSIPAEFLYAAGFETAAHRRLTLAFDILGQEAFDAERLTTSTTNGPGGNIIPVAKIVKDDLSIVNGSVGFKLNLFRRLVAASNLLFRLNDDGLRSKVVPMFSLSYSY